MQTTNYKVIEDNAGGVTLAMFDNGCCIAAITGYESAAPGMDLAADLADWAENDGDVSHWGFDCANAVKDPAAWWADVEANTCPNGYNVVADETGTYPEKMHASRGLLNRYVNISEEWGDHVEVTENDYRDQAKAFGVEIEIETAEDGIYINGALVAELV